MAEEPKKEEGETKKIVHTYPLVMVSHKQVLILSLIVKLGENFTSLKFYLRNVHFFS